MEAGAAGWKLHITDFVTMWHKLTQTSRPLSCVSPISTFSVYLISLQYLLLHYASSVYIFVCSCIFVISSVWLCLLQCKDTSPKDLPLMLCLVRFIPRPIFFRSAVSLIKFSLLGCWTVTEEECFDIIVWFIWFFVFILTSQWTCSPWLNWVCSMYWSSSRQEMLCMLSLSWRKYAVRCLFSKSYRTVTVRVCCNMCVCPDSTLCFALSYHQMIKWQLLPPFWRALANLPMSDSILCSWPWILCVAKKEKDHRVCSLKTRHYRVSSVLCQATDSIRGTNHMNEDSSI